MNSATAVATINLENTSQIKSKLNELKAKAYIPPKLPDDFLRTSLNEQQITENQDIILARRLQYGHNAPRVQRFTGTPPRGRLNITISEARLAKSYSMLTRMDPYVKITLEGKVFETETDYGGGKNPKWNKTIACYLPQNVDSFLLQIFDEKSFSTDEEIAVLNYALPDELFNGVPVDEWLPLSGKLGEQKEGNIHLRLEFIPLEHLRVAHQTPPIPIQQINQFQPIQQIRYPQITPQQIRSPQITPQQIPVHRNPEYSDADVKTLKEMFPSFDEEIVKSILEANDGNKENTINQLLQMS